MARCMLCSSTVDAHAITCPHCGGAVREEAGDLDVVGFAVDADAPSAPVAGLGTGSPWDDPTRVGPPAGGTGDGWVSPPAAPGAPTGWPGEVPAPPPVPGAPPPGPWAPAAAGPWGPPWGAPGAGSPPAPYGTAPFGSGPYGAAPGPGGPSSPYGAAAPPHGPDPYGVPFPAPGGYGPWPGYVAPRPTEGLAVASMVTSIVGVATALMCYLPILACPVGAVMGHVALGRIAREGKQGRGMAIAGIAIGWVGTALLVLGIILFAAVVASGP